MTNDRMGLYHLVERWLPPDTLASGQKAFVTHVRQDDKALVTTLMSAEGRELVNFIVNADHKAAFRATKKMTAHNQDAILVLRRLVIEEYSTLPTVERTIKLQKVKTEPAGGACHFMVKWGGQTTTKQKAQFIVFVRKAMNKFHKTTV
jgi:hypothetical protein